MRNQPVGVILPFWRVY